MAKQGMKRPDWTHPQPRNQVEPVPELQGKAKHGKNKAHSIIAGTSGANQKVFHTQKPIPSSDVYPAIDTDLARDNLQNDIPAADLAEL